MTFRTLSVLVQIRRPIDRARLDGILVIIQPVDDREVDRRSLAVGLTVAIESHAMAVVGPDICQIGWRRLRAISGEPREGEAPRHMVADRTRVVDGLRVIGLRAIVPRRENVVGPVGEESARMRDRILHKRPRRVDVRCLLRRAQQRILPSPLIIRTITLGAGLVVLSVLVDGEHRRLPALFLKFLGRVAVGGLRQFHADTMTGIISIGVVGRCPSKVDGHERDL